VRHGPVRAAQTHLVRGVDERRVPSVAGSAFSARAALELPG